MPILAITRREYASLFRIPLGWIVVALFAALSAIIFTASVLQPGQVATMRPFFRLWWSLVLIVAPAISMRLLSEESRTGTIESLLTSPVSDAAVVAGKYLAAVLFLATMLAPTLVFVLVLWSLAAPDPGPIVAGYAGILLLGMLYLSVGTLASALTSSQSLAFLGTLFALLLVDFAAVVIRGAAVPGWAATIVYAVSPSARMDDFAKGVIDTRHIVFFLAASFWFCSLAWVALQSRRWR